MEPGVVAQPGTDEERDADLPGYKNYLVFCDESGTHGSSHYGFGSLWIPAEARGRLYGLVDAVRARHRLCADEIKWNKVNRGNRAFYCDLVAAFFERQWLMFHALVVRKGYVNRELHDGSYDLARRKHFAMLIQNKVAFFARGSTDKAYHVRVDPLPSSYAKADEAAHKVSNHVLKNDIGLAAIKTLITRDSKRSLGIQLADLLVGAIVSDVCDEETGEHKLAVKRHIAKHLGWDDLAADTRRHDWKFNIWSFHDPTDQRPREMKTRDVNLLIPMPAWRRK